MNNTSYNMVTRNSQSTVVAEYTPDCKTATGYQSEAQLEKAFINELKLQAYEYLPINCEEQLVANLKKQLEKMNGITFSQSEWSRFFRSELANTNQGIEEKTRSIQEDYIKILRRDDGTEKNIYLLNKEDIHENSLQVINQYQTPEGKRVNRYDVTVLVNGLPLVHIELKRRGVAIKEAFNQINRYHRESFWASTGLFEYVQIYVISNGTHTKYYSNTTREEHIKEGNEGTRKQGKKTSNSFEFTSWWADSTNKPITDLIDFTRTFFSKHTILNILIRYCVFTTDNLLLVMRPYQIVATEKILSKIEISTNQKKLGCTDAGGYIWHTTGSGKTLTSFKTSQLASKLPYIDKVLFVVDRKDLDYQTMKEYDKFEKDSANSNTSTAILKQQLGDPNARIIITTIQKLDRFVGRNPKHTVCSDHIVIIFDECHRSQFGQMHTAITKAFKNYHIFGFTGTPIFAINASSSGRPDLKTTEQAFGKKLHTYSIVDAINDRNVLPFKVDYISTVREQEEIEDKKVEDINRDEVLSNPVRFKNIVEYIIENFDKKTKRNSRYNLKDRRLAGFNSIFTVSSIDFAKRYYTEFKKQFEGLPSDKRLKVAVIYSFGVNDEIDGMVDENAYDTSGLDESSRDFLDRAIDDYNKMFSTNFDTSSYRFQNYYKDVSNRVKNREIDILIVVNMFLTGFDATTLNTLWVDKNLRLHGLLQAFSRTNRILNSVKTFGNIVCFRNLEKATNESISLFGDKDASGIVLLKAYADYYKGYKEGDCKVPGYEELIGELQDRFPLRQRIVGEMNQKEFVKLYGSILKVRNILTTFDEFEGNEILSEREFQDYHSVYIDIYNEFRGRDSKEKESVIDDVVFEMELIKQIDVNIDYILDLIKKYHDDHIKNKEVLVNISKAVESSIELRNKRELIDQFITALDPHASVDEDWLSYVKKKSTDDLNDIVTVEGLKKDDTFRFMRGCFQSGILDTTGTSISRLILKPVSLFSPGNERTKKRESVIDRLQDYFDRFHDISSELLG